MEETGDFQDWEMLPSTEIGDDKFTGSDGIDGGSEGVIRPDYFSLGSEVYYGRRVAEENREEGSLGSDDLGGFDPRSKPVSDIDEEREVGFGEIEIVGGKSSALREEGPVAMEFGEFEGKGELGYGVDVKRKVGLGEIGEIQKVEVERENCSEFMLDTRGGDGKLGRKRELNYEGDAVGGSEGVEIDDENSAAFVLDSGGDKMMSGNISKTRDVPDSDRILEIGGYGLDAVRFADRVENGADVITKSGEGEKKSAVWYKLQLPLDIVKYCVFKVSPVWSLSIAAAMVGFVILRRKLYKMKQKNRNIPLKAIGIDDKKTSQVLIRVTRLNEAFSVVKRVPIIRSSLPGTRGVTPWPFLA